MTIYPKWKVNVTSQNYFCVEVDAASEEEAIEIAYNKIRVNGPYYLVSKFTIVNGIFINDKESREFQPYIPERLPRSIINDNEPESNEMV